MCQYTFSKLIKYTTQSVNPNAGYGLRLRMKCQCWPISCNKYITLVQDVDVREDCALGLERDTWELCTFCWILLWTSKCYKNKVFFFKQWNKIKTHILCELKKTYYQAGFELLATRLHNLFKDYGSTHAPRLGTELAICC